MEALIPLLAVFKDPVNMVLILVIILMGYFIKTTRGEDREDKAKMLEALNHNTDALNGVRNILAAMTGKAV